MQVKLVNGGRLGAMASQFQLAKSVTPRFLHNDLLSSYNISFNSGKLKRLIEKRKKKQKNKSTAK